jgi:hypothetical protein
LAGDNSGAPTGAGGSAPRGDQGSREGSGLNNSPVDQIEREIPDGPEANQEYARRATDLALEFLKDQQDRPDPGLLKELGWTAEELRAFVQRWESLKREAKESPAKQAELDEALQSLGLRPARDKKRTAGSRSDATSGNRDAGNRSNPPSSYQDQIQAFRKGISRVRDSSPRKP